MNENENGATAPFVRRIILDVSGERLNIGAEGCSPEVVEAALLRALAFIQRELQTMRLIEAWEQRARQAAQAAERKRLIDLQQP